MSPTTASTIARLARWLGPWTPAYRRPHDVRTRTLEISCTAPDHRPMRAWIYAPTSRAPAGSLLLVPGLHFAGPADPRLDRFARILASAGLVVLAPFLPDFISQVLDPRVLELVDD